MDDMLEENVVDKLLRLIKRILSERRINLTNWPFHVSLASEVTAVLRLTVSFLAVVNFVSGVYVQDSAMCKTGPCCVQKLLSVHSHLELQREADKLVKSFQSTVKKLTFASTSTTSH